MVLFGLLLDTMYWVNWLILLLLYTLLFCFFIYLQKKRTAHERNKLRIEKVQMEKDKQRWLDQLVNNTNNNNNNNNNDSPSQMQSPTKNQSRITSPGSPLFPDFQYVIYVSIYLDEFAFFCFSFELTFLHYVFLPYSYLLLLC